MPESHGLYILNLPQMHEKDCVSGANVPCFGTCKRGNAACAPNLSDRWRGGSETVHIWGSRAITTESWLVCRSGGGVITFLDSGWDDVAASRLSRGMGGRPGAGGALLVPEDGKDVSVRELNEAQGNAVNWDGSEGKGKSTITIATKFGSEVKLKEGEDYYIGEDGKAYYHNNVRAILEAQDKKVIFTQGENKGESAIKVTTAMGAFVQTFKEGEDYYIGKDGKAHFTKGTVPPGGEKPGGAPAQGSGQVGEQMQNATDFVWPLPGSHTHITSYFGPRIHPITKKESFHGGIDISAPNGTEIYAVATGTITFAGVKGTYGNLVIIDHGNGIQTYYAHQSKMKVTAGSIVNSGDAIGEVGSTGSSTGNHLHFEVKINGTSQNPLEYLNAR
jgi:murein DD-endopeptidase MepM/ murein hydrolase activator NlpD